MTTALRRAPAASADHPAHAFTTRRTGRDGPPPVAHRRKVGNVHAAHTRAPFRAIPAEPEPVSVLALDPSAGPEVASADFGQALRAARRAADLTQADLVRHLDRAFARSTLANIETGRERPSQRLLTVLVDHFPEWEGLLTPAFERSRRQPATTDRRRATRCSRSRRRVRNVLGGPYQLEHLQIAYVFRHSHAPEEIIETRRIRATSTGGDGFGMRLKAQSEGFESEDEILWGGRLDMSSRHVEDGHAIYLQRVDFGKTLRRGEVHEFAVRHWVERDPVPDPEALFSLTLPADEVSLHMRFLGPSRPRRIFRVGPLADHCLVREQGCA